MPRHHYTLIAGMLVGCADPIVNRTSDLNANPLIDASILHDAVIITDGPINDTPTKNTDIKVNVGFDAGSISIPDAKPMLDAHLVKDMKQQSDITKPTDASPDAKPPTASGWKLVFQEDFNGTSVDKTRWSMYDSPGHAGNGLRKPTAFSVKNGILTVTAQMLDGKLVSGGMSHKSNYLYGKFEFRVRTEVDPSTATSGVILTWPQSGKWPEDGENDIYETGTQASRNPFKTFIHYDVSNKQYYYIHSSDGTQWHVMTMEWEADALKIYRNGTWVWTMPSKTAIPKVPHHICIQLDAFKKTMTGIVNMYVDWVKIYQK